MNEDPTIIALVEDIRNTFPADAKKADEMEIGLGHEIEWNLHHLWIETFADVSNNLIRNRLKHELEAHFNYFENQFNIGSESVKSCIDVSYVENLMWNLEQDDKKWAWPLFPQSLRSIYVAIWGEPNF